MSYRDLKTYQSAVIIYDFTSRASFQELLEDYEDFLRQRRFVLWGKDSVEAREVRGFTYKTDKSYQTYRVYLSDPIRAANCMICLINQENFLLDRQIKSLEEKFVQGGGYTEEFFRRRLNYRKQQ